MSASRLKNASAICPCCGYVTVARHGAFEICILCWWEDDGQSDKDADVVRGGPNGNYSLTEARRNFQDHLTMYRVGEDTRIGGEDSSRELGAKRKIIEALEELRAGASGARAARAWASIEENEDVLESEDERKRHEYEATSGNGTA